MAVFENLKNFIRHGKQAYATHGSSNTISSVTSPSDTSSPVTSISTPLESNDRKVAYNDALEKIVAEENEQRSKLPQYKGLERYALTEKMGDGAFSIVYKAKDLHTNDYVAVKVIRKQDLNSSQDHSHIISITITSELLGKRPWILLTSILKEVAIMRQLRHDNIVRLIDFIESPDHYFIVLELLPGGELFHQIVRLTYFSEDLSRHVILQVAHAVRYLHETAGVVHRDIKPENLLFYPCDFVPSKVKVVRKGEDESKEDEGEFIPGVGSGGIGTIKLADFGLSKVIWDSKTMTPCGTVGYTAPEIVKDERYSKSVDMWALGCVLYTILCGFPPFYDESIEVLTEKVAKGQYTFLSPWWDEISPAAKDLVSHLLTVDPDKRYTIDEFLNHPWITQSAGKTTRVAPPQVSVKTKLIVSETLESAEGRREKEFATSVAATTLKEVFDVSNAVHRMEEENIRRRHGLPAALLNTGNIVEEEEEEGDEENRDGAVSPSATTVTGRDDLMEGVQRSMERVTVGAPSAPLINTATARAGRRRVKGVLGSTGGGVGTGTRGKFFDLHLEGATLLERRKRGTNQVLGPVPSLIT